MPRTPAAPKVPGETAPAAPVVEEQETKHGAAEAAQSQPEADNPAAAGDTVTVSKTELAALMNRLSALEKAQAKPTATRANPEADLPDQDSVDLATLKSPVLTKQGWLVPEQYGAHPNAKPL